MRMIAGRRVHSRRSGDAPPRARPAVSAVRATVAAAVVGLVLVLAAVPGGATTAAAPAPAITRDIDYSGGTSDHNHLDAYVPQSGTGNRAAVVLVHGGGWTTGDKQKMAPDAAYLAAAGYAAFSISYGVDELPRWPGELEDAQMAVRWVQDHANEYGLDPTRVGIFGGSAGGNLAMLVGTAGTGEDHPPVKAVVSWSGPSDLTTLAVTNIPGDELATPSTVPIPGAEIPPGCVGTTTCLGVYGPQFIQAYMDCTLRECPEQYREASPVFGVTASTPPMYVASAEQDLVPVEQAYEMVNALTAGGIASKLQVVPGEGHADSYRAQAQQPTLDFLHRYLIEDADPHVPTNAPPSVVPGSAPLPPLDAAGRLPTPAVPAAANPRTGVFGFVARNIRWFVRGAVVLGLVVLVVIVVTARRRRRPNPGRTG